MYPLPLTPEARMEVLAAAVGDMADDVLALAKALREEAASDREKYLAKRPERP